MNYWPGTKIVKSRGNAFDWQGKCSEIVSDPKIRMSNATKKQMATVAHKKSFTIYSKARKSI